jgi:hypothetical protein
MTFIPPAPQPCHFLIEAFALSQINRIIAYAHRASAQRSDREGRIECKPSLDRSLRFINSTPDAQGPRAAKVLSLLITRD